MKTTALLVGIYLVAIVAANLFITELGPEASIYTAFALIGLDLAVRDRLHEGWRGRQLALRMGALIVAGSAVSWVVQADAGRIALASAVAFGVSLTADALVFSKLDALERPRWERWNGSNVASAVVDSILFPTLAFGVLLPEIIVGQVGAKIAGGLVWTFVLLGVYARRDDHAARA